MKKKNNENNTKYVLLCSVLLKYVAVLCADTGNECLRNAPLKRTSNDSKQTYVCVSAGLYACVIYNIVKITNTIYVYAVQCTLSKHQWNYNTVECTHTRSYYVHI